MANKLDLGTIFQGVYQNLAQKKDDLNEADTYNHDHGDHMVQIFDLIQKAVSKKKEEPAPEQLKYASQVIKKEADSGSAKLYAQGLEEAAKNLAGSELTPENVSTLVKSLLGAEKKTQGPQEKQGGLLGSLLSGLTGGQSENQEEGLGVDDLLRAGLAFYQSKQEGDNTTEAVMDALLAASPMGESAHRSQSGTIVASTIMQLAQSFTKK